MSVDSPAIIGICLVRNEDRFLQRALRNVLPFCDRILIADHGSTDGTPEIAQEMARLHPGRFEVHRIGDPRESSEMLAGYANTRTWVLGVDGDELYDPAGLVRLRAELARGLYDEWWVLFGSVLHCTELDEERRIAKGFMAPPCRSMTKLYNFNAVARLDPRSPQRLMGLRNEFNPGWDPLKRLELYQTTAWADAHFRCLHTCFLARSSQEGTSGRMRENLTELRRHSPAAWVRRAWARVRGREVESAWKLEKYRRGPVVSVDAAAFLLDDPLKLKG